MTGIRPGVPFRDWGRGTRLVITGAGRGLREGATRPDDPTVL